MCFLSIVLFSVLVLGFPPSVEVVLPFVEVCPSIGGALIVAIDFFRWMVSCLYFMGILMSRNENVPFTNCGHSSAQVTLVVFFLSAKYIEGNKKERSTPLYDIDIRSKVINQNKTSNNGCMIRQNDTKVQPANNNPFQS